MTQVELAVLATNGDAINFIDAHGCAFFERTWINNQQVLRFRCTDSRGRFVERFTLPTGDMTQEPRGFAAFKAKLKTVGLYTVAGIIFVVYIYGKSQS